MIANGRDEPELLTLDLPHLRMAALAWGPPDGRLALCLHGFPDTAWTWRRLGPLLAAQGYRVVAPFSRGYAPTAIPADGDYHIGALMYDAIEVHRNLGAPSDAVLIGHDWGAFTAVGLAAQPDSHFERVVALAVPLLFGMPTRPTGRVIRRMPSQARKSWYVLYQQLPVLPERTFVRVIPRLWQDWCPPGYDMATDVARVFDALPDRARRTAALNYYRYQFQPRRQLPRYRTLHRTWRTEQPRVPMLVMHGGIDGGLDDRLAAISAEALPANCRHVMVAEAGHFVHLDAPQTVFRYVVEHANAISDTAEMR